MVEEVPRWTGVSGSRLAQLFARADQGACDRVWLRNLQARPCMRKEKGCAHVQG